MRNREIGSGVGDGPLLDAVTPPVTPSATTPPEPPEPPVPALVTVDVGAVVAAAGPLVTAAGVTTAAVTDGETDGEDGASPLVPVLLPPLLVPPEDVLGLGEDAVVCVVVRVVTSAVVFTVSALFLRALVPDTPPNPPTPAPTLPPAENPPLDERADALVVLLPVKFRLPPPLSTNWNAFAEPPATAAGATRLSSASPSSAILAVPADAPNAMNGLLA